MSLIQQPRRKFLQIGLTGFFTTLFTGLSKTGFSQSTPGNEKGIVVHQNEGQHILTGRRKAPVNIKISKQQHGVENISFCTEDIIPGGKIRVHKHLTCAELIFIHRGEGRFTLDEELIELKTGDVAFVPRNVWHGLENTGKENLAMIFQYSPAGFEEYFLENGTLVGMPDKNRTPEEYAITEKKFGIVFKEPRN